MLANADANTNTFVVSVKDTAGLSNTATLYIYVNGAPSLIANPFNMPDIIAGQTYSGTIATNATDPNSADTRSFAKVSGPARLVVGKDGKLTGESLSADIGNNSFVVSVTDPRSLSGSAALNFNAPPPPATHAALSASGTDLLLN